MRKDRGVQDRWQPGFLFSLLLVLTFYLMAVMGVKAEELPGAVEAPSISFRLDGECTGDMVYVKPEGDGDFQSLTTLKNDGKIQDNGNGEYCLDSGIASASVYIKYDPAKQMLQGDITGTSEETATTVNEKRTYMIQVDPKINTITWAYSEEIYGADAYLEHGRAEVIAIEGISDFHEIPFANNPGDDKGGHIAVDAGKEVTIRLTPDYGYQLSGVQLNGATLTAQEEMYTFTFTMPDTSVHFKGIFTRTEDKTRIDTQSQSISSATIENGANAVKSGNLQLTVADNTGYNVSAAQQTVTGAAAAQAVELELSQIVAKGDGTNWETQIHEFANPITLSLGISNYDAGYDYVVVRDHNGSTTVLDTKVIDGKVTFETNQFSTYVIVKKEKTTAGSGDNTDDDSDGEDANSSATQTAATQVNTQELDAVPKTGEGIGSYGMEMVLFLGGIVLVCTGILLGRKRESGK